MKRPEKVEEALDWIGNESCCEVIFNYISNLETKVQCLDEIIVYMKDDTVTWRDISDDIINDILKKYNYK